MKLRVRGPDMIKFDLEVAEDASYDELVALITHHCGTANWIVKTSYPTAAIRPESGGERLLALGIRPSDTLTIERALGVDNTTRPSALAPPNEQMVIREIPDDNSCLFNAVAYVLCDHARNQGDQLRQLAAATVVEDENMDSASLGMSKSEYCTWILKRNTWGGAIELSIFARYFGTEIASIDVQTGRVDVFGEGSGYGERVYLLYSGIHYDALALALGDSESQGELDVTIFGVDDTVALEQALAVAEEAKKMHKYTDLAKFTLKCEDCGTLLIGEQQAQQHAIQTLHANFVEYS